MSHAQPPVRRSRQSQPATDRGAGDAPVHWLTVLSDPDCPLCSFLRRWLERQRQLVPLYFVDVGSAEARARFPQLDQVRAQAEITVVGDAGQVYEGQAAWIVCLWALAGHRTIAHRLSTPAGLPLARAAVVAAATGRKLLTRRDGGGGTGTAAATARGAAAAAATGPGDDDPSCGADCRAWSG
ncbi:putative DCC family thiol-disulfide oxidoreductase YuxK [Streptacidiphilus sp. MAP12-33]|uniref:thiol-disulfide oxidoreductase DCC family protein n=1 Tax=Streptacidiphilus sp. MAP12-33 TaxID=3156266 RepID=UPI003515B2C9